MVSWHFWLATAGIVLYASAMWVSGIMQGLMWRETNELGFLVYSFAETVEAMHPFYVIRVIGGVLYLLGGLMMAWNIYKTIKGDVRREAAYGGVRRLSPRRPSKGGRDVDLDAHQKIEKNATLLLVLSLLVVTVGGIVEIAPLFYLQNTIEKVKGMRPYTPLELAGATSTSGRGAISATPRWSARCATRSSATAISASPRSRCTTIRSSGARSGPGRTSPASAAATPTSGTCST
jgi:hypothetical protein